MTDQEIIQALKDNEKPFGLMSEEMQEKVKEIGIIEFQYWDFGWETCQIRDWADGACYRLRPGYEEKALLCKKCFTTRTALNMDAHKCVPPEPEEQHGKLELTRDDAETIIGILQRVLDK